MSGLDLELNTQRVHEFEYGFVPGLGTRREGFIETFARNTCVFGQLCHASGRVTRAARVIALVDGDSLVLLSLVADHDQAYD